MEKIMRKDQYTLAEIANITGAKLQGDPQCIIYGIASLEKASQGQMSFLVNSRYQLISSSKYEKFLPTTKASAVLLSPAHADACPVNKLIIDDPYQGYLKIASLFERQTTAPLGVHPSAIVGASSKIASTASIGPNCVIGDGCEIGEGTRIEANTVIGDCTIIGKDGYIAPNVTIHRDVKIGDRVVILPGAAIGCEGFGMVRDPQGWKKIPHLGTVIIGDDVEIGANTTIDRGSVDDTILENGVKLDNQIQIAHGVVIGENTIMAGCSGVAGSTHVGKNCMIGGATAINDNIVIADNVIITGMSQVTKSIPKAGVYSSGTGLFTRREWQKNVARLHKLDDLARKLRKLEKDQNE